MVSSGYVLRISSDITTYLVFTVVVLPVMCHTKATKSQEDVMNTNEEKEIKLSCSIFLYTN